MKKTFLKSNQSKVKKLLATALSDTKDQTLLVEVVRIKVHPLYAKRYQRRRKFLVHSLISVKTGEKVLIEQCRPVSKRKSWRAIEVVK